MTDLTLTHDEIMAYALRHADIEAAGKLYVDRAWGGITLSNSAIRQLLQAALGETPESDTLARSCERTDGHFNHYWYGNYTYYCPGINT